MDPIGKWLNETPSRVPMTDWYDSKTGVMLHFQARSVVGGVFHQGARRTEAQGEVGENSSHRGILVR